jgi:hypothetical protein
MLGIVLEGEAAVVQRQRLLTEGREVPINLWERDARGRKKRSSFQFGMNASSAWVFCRVDEKGVEPRLILEEVFAHEAASLFGGYLDRIELRRGLVDPSPLSAELVDVNPCVADMVEDLKEVFGVGITLR